MGAYYKIRGGNPINGRVRISGAKNASLPILAASILADSTITLSNVPILNDVSIICLVLESLGVSVEMKPNRVVIDPSKLTGFEAPYELMNKMRASVYVMGPLLAKYNRARIALPGGCAIGARPINFHLKGFAELGAEIEISHGFVEARTHGLKGATLALEFPSVGATANLMMAATLARGRTEILNAAQEPHIIDLAGFLNALGAEVTGAGSREITIIGRQSLHGADYSIIADQIEAGTFLLAGAAADGDVAAHGIGESLLEPLLSKLKSMGVEYECGEDYCRVKPSGRPGPANVETMPYPGFPTDLQAPIMAALATASGVSAVTETVFENRFRHVPELARMGADITDDGRTAVVRGLERLSGAPVTATDLRAGAALVIAALAADGETRVLDSYHIQRGYERFAEKLSGLGADIELVEDL